MRKKRTSRGKSREDKIVDLTSDARQLQVVTADLQSWTQYYHQPDTQNQVSNLTLAPLMLDFYMVIDRNKFTAEYDASDKLPDLKEHWNRIILSVGGRACVDGPTLVHSLKIFPLGRAIIDGLKKARDQLDELLTWRSTFDPVLQQMNGEFEATAASEVITKFAKCLDGKSLPPFAQGYVTRVIGITKIRSSLLAFLEKVVKAIDFSTPQDTRANIFCHLRFLRVRGMEEKGVCVGG